MPRARIQGRDYEVRVTRDLADSWAVEVAPLGAPPRPVERYKPTPPILLVKLRATSAEAAARGALETLKQQGKLDDFTV